MVGCGQHFKQKEKNQNNFMFTLLQIKESLIGMAHGSTLNKVRNQEALFERVASKFLTKCKPLETVRIAALSSTVHDDLNDYSLPSDYNALIDLIPQGNRDSWDTAFRDPAGKFDLQKAIKNRRVSIEGSEGSKIIRINWKSRQPVVAHSMDSLTDNGTWSAVASASGLAVDEIIKRKGNASIKFDISASNDGISNTGLSELDLTNEDEVGDVLLDLYIKNSADLANFNSITGRWGNDITTNYWDGVAQTLQADGSALQVGWNEIKIPWSTATETGTVDVAAVDSLRFIFSVDAAIADMRIDNVRFSIGRNFDIKYYSKYLFKNTSGTYLSRPSTDEDYVLVDNDSLPIFLYECLIEIAQQMEGTDSAFDIEYARRELGELYPAFRSEYPDQRKKVVFNYGGKPRWQNRY